MSDFVISTPDDAQWHNCPDCDGDGWLETDLGDATCLHCDGDGGWFE